MTLDLSLPHWAAPLTPIGDPEVRRALVDLFERADRHARQAATEGRIVVVVLVSRRLSCLYEMFEANGFDGFSDCIVVSDRALQGSVRVASHQQVIVIDDALILGTTLVDTYDEIAGQLGDQPAITALVAMVDEERRNPHFMRHLGIAVDAPDAPLQLSTKELEDVARDIASCLYKAGRPYFTDFPLVRELRMTEEQWAQLQSSPRWLVFDVTAPQGFGGADRTALSFFPVDAAAASIRAKGHPEAMALLEGAKVRVYADAADADGMVRLRIVPMGLPCAVMVPRLRHVLEAIELELEAGRGWRSWKPEAQHRLLQMYLSTCVLAEFWHDVAGTGVPVVLESALLDQVHIRCYFGLDDVAYVTEAFDQTVHAYTHADRTTPAAPAAPLLPGSGLASEQRVRRWTVSNARMVDAAADLNDRLDLIGGVAPEPQAGEVVKVDPFWVHRVLSIFGKVDTDMERTQEEDLRDWPYERYRDDRQMHAMRGPGARIVKEGITLAELAELFTPMSTERSSWSFAALSLAIDVGNDLGIIVPSTVCGGPQGPVFRQYRSGEMAYAAKTPHQSLTGDAESLAADIDLYTSLVLGDIAASRQQGPDEVRDQFASENRRLATISRDATIVEQAWIAEVTQVGDTDFEVFASSRLDDGVETTARLPLGRLPQDERDSLRAGDTVYWTIFNPDDETGRPQPGVELRRVCAPHDT